MSNQLGEGTVRIRADTAGFAAGAKQGILGPLAGIAKVAGGLFAASKVVDFFHSTIDAASDLNESLSKSQQVFKGSAKDVEAFASTAATKLGISKQAALESTATFGNLFRSMGDGPKQASNLSTHLVKLAGDLASFNNVSPEEALEALRSGVVGEVEPLRKFGVNLSQTAIQAQALSSGILKPTKNLGDIKIASEKASLAQSAYTTAVAKHGKTSDEAKRAAIALETSQKALNKATAGNVPPLTAAQKATAAYQLIMKQTKLAQGDFGRTSSGLANQQRILAAQVTDLKAKIGTALLPVVLALVGWMSKGITAFSNAWPQIQATSREVIGLAQKGFAVLNPKVQAVVGIFRDVIDRLGGVKAALKDVVAAVIAGLAIWGTVTLVTGIYSAVQAAIFLVRNAQLALNVAMEANPVGIVVLALTALAVGLYIAYNRSATFRNIVNDAFAVVKRVAKDALDWISKTGLPAMRAAFDAVVPPVTSAIKKVVGVITGLISSIRENWGTIKSIIVPPLEAVWNQVKLTVGNAIAFVEGIIDTFVDVLHGRWGDAWGDLKGLAKTALSQLTGTLSNLMQALSATLGRLAVAAAKKIADGIKKAPSFLVGLAGDMLAKLGAVIKQVASSAYTLALSIGSKVIDGIKDGVANALPSALSALGSAAKKLADKANPLNYLSAVRIGDTLTQQIAGSVSTLGTKLAASLTTQITSAVTSAKQNLTGLTGGLASDIGAIIDAGTAQAIAGIPAKLTAAISGVAAGSSLSDAAAKIAGDQAARQKRNLEQALAAAKQAAGVGPGDNQTQAQLDQAQKDAQEDLDDFLLQAQIDLDTKSYNAKVQAAQDAAALAKTSVNDQLANWTAMYNQGLIDQTTYLADISGLITTYANGDGTVTWGNAGDLLGFAFAQSMQAHIDDIKAQINAIATAGPAGIGGSGVGGDVTQPSDVLVQKAIDTLADKNSDATAVRKAQAALKAAQGKFAEAHDVGSTIAATAGNQAAIKAAKTTEAQLKAAEAQLAAAQAAEKRDTATYNALVAILNKIGVNPDAQIAAGSR